MKDSDTKLLVAIILLLIALCSLVIYSIHLRDIEQRQVNTNVQKIQDLSEIVKSNKQNISHSQAIETQLQTLPNRGPQGIPGPQGVQGEQGVPGKDGARGKNGKSAPVVQVRCNPLKLENEWKYSYEILWHPLDKVSGCA